MTVTNEAMGMEEPEKRRVTIGDVVREALDALPDVYDDEELYGEDGWKAPFAVARRIQMALFKLGVDYSSIPTSVFFSIVQEWAQYHLPEDESFMLSFARMWGEVRLPEGYDPAEFAYSQTVRSDWRLEVDQAYYTRDVEAEDASTILTLFAHLQDWLREEQKLPFCPVRKLGKLLDKSPQYVAELIRCLRAEGALVEVEPGTTRRSPRYRVVDKQSDRKPLQRNYRRSRRSEEAEGPGGLGEGTEDGARFHKFLDGEVIEEDLGEDVPGGGVQ